jgi:Family of unknown function (DUF5684)
MVTLSVVVVWALVHFGAWRIFEKAGVSGWVALVPGLNLLGLLKVLGRSYLWVLAFLPPLTPFALFVSAVLVARRFGRGTLFGAGMFFLPFVFLPVLGFSEVRYLGRDR